jgi:hypothetical protein
VARRFTADTVAARHIAVHHREIPSPHRIRHRTSPDRAWLARIADRPVRRVVLQIRAAADPLRPEAETEVQPERNGDLLRHEPARRPPIDPPHKFTEQMPVREGVLGGDRARRPFRFGGGQIGAEQVPVRPRSGRPGHLEGHQPRRVAEAPAGPS